MPNACGAHFSAFSRSATTRRGFNQPSSTDTAIERAAHPLKRGRGGNVFVTINSGDAPLLSPRPRLQPAGVPVPVHANRRKIREKPHANSFFDLGPRFGPCARAGPDRGKAHIGQSARSETLYLDRSHRRKPRLSSRPSFFHPSTNRGLGGLIGAGVLGARDRPCRQSHSDACQSIAR
jgi:hypothetical protein